MTDNNTIRIDAQYSALGEQPLCDVCKHPIMVGERVSQTFVGTVKILDLTDELVVEENEGNYILDSLADLSEQLEALMGDDEGQP